MPTGTGSGTGTGGGTGTGKGSSGPPISVPCGCGTPPDTLHIETPWGSFALTADPPAGTLHRWRFLGIRFSDLVLCQGQPSELYLVSPSIECVAGMDSEGNPTHTWSVSVSLMGWLSCVIGSALIVESCEPFHGTATISLGIPPGQTVGCCNNSPDPNCCEGVSAEVTVTE